MTMPRGNIAVTVAEMEALTVELRALSEGFDAVGDTQKDHLRTEPDLQLQRWAASYADSLRRIADQAAGVAQAAKEDVEPGPVDWLTRKDWRRAYELAGLEPMVGDAVRSMLDVLRPLWSENLSVEAVAQALKDRWAIDAPPPLLRREQWRLSAYAAADTLGTQLEAAIDAADVTDDVKEWWGREVRFCRGRLAERRKLAHP